MCRSGGKTLPSSHEKIFILRSSFGPLETVEATAYERCFVKTTSRLVARLLEYVNAAATLLILLGACLGFSSLVGLSLLCSRKRTTPLDEESSQRGLVCNMCCPCFPEVSAQSQTVGSHRPLKETDYYGGGSSFDRGSVSTYEGYERDSIYDVDSDVYVQG